MTSSDNGCLYIYFLEQKTPVNGGNPRLTPLLKSFLRWSLYFIAFQEKDVFQFEMDESQLSNVLSSIDEIEKKLESYAQ